MSAAPLRKSFNHMIDGLAPRPKPRPRPRPSRRPWSCNTRTFASRANDSCMFCRTLCGILVLWFPCSLSTPLQHIEDAQRNYKPTLVVLPSAIARPRAMFYFVVDASQLSVIVATCAEAIILSADCALFHRPGRVRAQLPATARDAQLDIPEARYWSKAALVACSKVAPMTPLPRKPHWSAVW